MIEVTPIRLRAHYDGTAIQLDEPFELPVNAQLIVTVLPADSERSAWQSASAMALDRAYGPNEPEYSDGDLLT
jgi:hypothetical protein